MTRALIPRPHAMEWLQRWRNEEPIKVITGMRRCGKSSVLRLFQEYLKEQGTPSSNIVAINFESMDTVHPTEPQALYNYLVERFQPGMNYVFLDEIQRIPSFERTVNALALRDDTDLYVTGSNAFILSSELATLITGRYVELQMHPFSFAEYKIAHPSQKDTEALFNRYLMYGGLPYTAHLDNDQSIADYLGGVFNTIVMSDVASRHPRMDMLAFQRTMDFLTDNIGNISSLKRISNALKNAGKAVSVGAINEYVSALIENYLLYKVPRYNIKGHEYLETLEKYYLADLGFRYWLLGKTQNDIGHRLENVVYLELLRRYDVVNVGKINQFEVDFVALANGIPTYVQVAQSIVDPKVQEREFGPLRAIKDNYPKLVLSLDKIGVGDYAGIEQRNIIDWLLEK